MNANIAVAWLLATVVLLSSCGGGDSSDLMPVVTSEIAPDGLSYPDPNMFTQGVEITPLLPTVAKGTPTNFMVTPDLPAGLKLGWDGVISGTPTEPRAPTTYLVTAGNAAGVSSFGVRITVMGRFTVGGNVSGLSGPGLVLTNRGADPLAIDMNGPFAFSQTFGAGTAYDVAIVNQPPGQTCAVAQGTGNITNVIVGTIAVTCATTSPKAARPAATLTSTLQALADDARHFPYVTCTGTTADPIQVQVLDRATGLISPLGEAVHRYSDTDRRGATHCGTYAVTLDRDGQWVHVTNIATHVVTVYPVESR
jgi:hypothetical protein